MHTRARGRGGGVGVGWGGGKNTCPFSGVRLNPSSCEKQTTAFQVFDCIVTVTGFVPVLQSCVMVACVRVHFP